MIFNCPSCKGPVSIEIGDWPFDCHGRGHYDPSYSRGDANIHSSERTVVYQHPSSNKKEYPDIRPGRADRAMHPKYAGRGYQRVELDNHVKVKEWEKQNNALVERRHFDKNSARAEREMGAE